MSKFVKIAGLGFALLLALFISASSANATRYDIQGLVFMDNNLNGIWDVGESGYDGQWQWVENEEMFRYVGATVTILTPAYDEYEVETMGYRDLEEHEQVFCTQQDLFLEDDELNPNPVRPCAGTWGFPVSVEDTYMQITLTPPDGYYVTSSNPQFCVTGDSHWMDFGLAPIAESESSAGETVTDEAEAAAAAEAPFHMTVEAKDVVPGLVFIDTNLDGVWQPGEAGYGGQFMWDADKELNRYVGATVTFISPAYDDYEIETMGYRELEEHETVACTQQDVVVDGELNPNPVRPCSGTFALSHAGEDVYWEVWLTVPQGYYLTTANPQYYITGTGQMPVDFGIAPITD
jgi:hypothetical protein